MKNLIFTTLFCFSSVLPLLVSAEPDCGNEPVEIKTEHVVASANVVSNTLNRTGSVRFESTRLLEGAIRTAKSENDENDQCPPNCKLAVPAEVVFTSTPNKFLKNYSEKAVCSAQAEVTSKTPLNFNKQMFKSVNDFGDWLNDFSQGKGKEGEDLYERYPGSCSPRYSYLITVQGPEGQIKAIPSVVCGHARDKGDNQFILSYKVIGRCIPR